MRDPKSIETIHTNKNRSHNFDLTDVAVLLRESCGYKLQNAQYK